MNPHLQNALAELQSAGAQGLPREKAVSAAKDGTTWSGKLSDNGDWTLIKNGENSYTNNTRSNP